MKIAVLGTGPVGSNIASKLIELGHDVKMGSRTPDNKLAAEWVAKSGAKASQGTFSDAASSAEMIFNCTNGAHSLEALNAAGAENLKGKVLVDVANPLDFSTGTMKLTVNNTDSLAEQIQRAFPEAKVVKTLNTVTKDLHTNPSALQGEHDVFLNGNDKQAKDKVAELLRSFGWKSIVDLGGIETARGTEAMLLMLMPVGKAFPDEYTNYKIVHSKKA